MLIGTQDGWKHGMRTCRACGCTDLRACQAEVATRQGPRVATCSWVLLDIDEPTGVCSVCADALDWHPLALRGVGREEAA